jgi:hypothetical protein
MRDAARAGDYHGFTTLGERSAAETALFANQPNFVEDQPMHKHKRKVDYVIHCYASEHALAAIIIETPDEKDVQRPFYRRLHPHEAGCSSVLRELTVLFYFFFKDERRHAQKRR